LKTREEGQGHFGQKFSLEGRKILFWNFQVKGAKCFFLLFCGYLHRNILKWEHRIERDFFFL